MFKIYRIEGPGENEAPRQIETENKPDPGQWWADEQEFDHLIGLKLQGTPLPANLKWQLLEIPKATSITSFRRKWAWKFTPIAAAIVIIAVFFGSWRGPFQPSVSLADYRAEMVSFIRIDPALEFETARLSAITAFLEDAGAPSHLHVPPKLQQMQQPLGCRVLRFRRENVALVSFGREQGDLVHLFVVNRAALPHLRESDKTVRYQPEGAWMTATWLEADQAYLLTVKGDRAKLEKYLPSS